jgi:DNA gyrase subunit A
VADQLGLFGKRGGGNGDSQIILREEARRRYLNYALSVITARALPDVRDGLKPVQRRILYSMFANLHLYPDAKFKKCATVVGDVLGKFHPHGDTAAYDALVRMAQDFSLRYPLVDGHGNFGSLDGDAPAAYRYTEAKLQPIAMELLAELRKRTVEFRPNFDGTTSEPIVMPARVPNLLINGASGIAVGMATNIPPHNLGEVCEALVALIDDKDLSIAKLCQTVRGPDFPTGGQILNSRKEIREIYESGQGGIRVQGEYKVEDLPRGRQQVVITSIPYALSKATVVEKIAEIIVGRKVPNLVDVRDESTNEVRIVLELKTGAEPQVVMAYLYKHTPLQTNFNVNLTCLVPTDKADISAPERLDLKKLLQHFLDFRFEVVTKRFQFELDELKKRIHLLEGFRKIYDALDEALRIIRKSDGKQDAAEKLMKRFKLDDEQADAVLETKLYKLARLEIKAILDELKEKKEEAKRIEAILASKKKLWGVVKDEILAVGKQYGDKRRTKLGGEELEYQEEAYIVSEDANVILSRDGWVKRVREIKDLSTIRLREGDDILAVLRGSTLKNVAFFSNQGVAYVTRIADLPATTGYGEPAQKLFKMDDGERVVGGLSLDEKQGELPAELLAVSKNGYGLRFALAPHLEVSTRAGRKYARPSEGDELVGVQPAAEKDPVSVVTESGHALVCKAGEINLLANPGRGVTVIKVKDEDRVMGFAVGKEGMTVETEKGKQIEVSPKKYEITSRGGKGHAIVKKDRVVRVVPPEIKLAPQGDLVS